MSQYRNTAISQYRHIAIPQYHNIGGNVTPAVLAVDPEGAIVCFSFPAEDVTMETAEVTRVTDVVTNPLLPPLSRP